LNVAASAVFEKGTHAGDMGDRYVRITVLLATVLLFTAIGQRFRVTSVRTGLLITAFCSYAFRCGISSRCGARSKVTHQRSPE